MLIKICGINNVEIAKKAAIAGANYIGLLFSNISPRKIDINLAKEITKEVRASGAEVVAVFVDESLEEMLNIINELNLKLIQLHGNKVRALCDKLPEYLQIIYVVDGKELPPKLNPNKDFLLFEKIALHKSEFRYFIAGGLNIYNVSTQISLLKPHGVDVSSGVEESLAKKDDKKIKDFINKVRLGYYGDFGGQYVPELLIKPLKELETAYNDIAKNAMFRNEYENILKNYLGRPTPITEIKSFAKTISLKNTPRIFLKREDLLHTGAHKINNAVGQCLLAKKMGKTRIIAETGAGQHGLATATVCAMFGLECIVYMGSVDIERQSPNVAKMKLLGAKVIAVNNGSATLKDAVNEALRDWAYNYEISHYCLGSALGPHPFPKIVADFQSIIGKEAKEQIAIETSKNPNVVIACIGGGSNAIGIFSAFIDNEKINLIGVEAGGVGSGLGNNAARFQEGRVGVLHGAKTFILQDNNNQIVETYSISAGLDYPAVGPQHSYLFTTGRVTYEVATDSEALEAFKLLIKTEGIIPALESAHALAYIMKNINNYNANDIILINLSGRGDKDLPQLLSGVLKNATD
ncbi:MAG TPA: tryptophan synthase subunit beta [Burkholderiales bacterium]|nr:tryptophan synthase subunit beta [Burkholderiales bacterium]